MRVGLRNYWKASLVVFIFLYILPSIFAPSYTPSTIVESPNMNKDFMVADIGKATKTAHGTKTYLGNNLWSYSTVLGECNSFDGSQYVSYLYDDPSHTATFAGHTLTLYDWYAVFSNGSGVLVDDMRWVVQYWQTQGGGRWVELDLYDHSFLTAVEGSNTLKFGQQYTDGFSILDVWYTVRNNDNIKITLNFTAENTEIYRFQWQITGVDGELQGSNKSISFDNVNINWGDTELNATYEWTVATKKLDISFDNVTVEAASSYILDPSVNPVIGADSDDDWWWYDTDGPTYWTHRTTYDYIYMQNYNKDYWYVGGQRFTLAIPQGATISSANVTCYELYDGGTNDAYIYRMDETNIGSLEADSSIPNRDWSEYAVYDFDSVASEWGYADVTDLVQSQVDLIDWSSGYYIGFHYNHTTHASENYRFEDYSNAGTNHAYMNVTYTAQEDYVDQISDLHTPSDIGTHSDFTEEQDKDGNFDTLTEGNTGETFEYKADAFVDAGGDFDGTANCYDGDWGTYQTDSVFSNADDYPLCYAYNFDSANSGTGTIGQVDIVLRVQLQSSSASDTIGFTFDVGASTDNVLMAHTDQSLALQNYTYTDVTEPNDASWSWSDVWAIQVNIDGEKNGGGDGDTLDVYEFAVKVTTINYDLDLEVGWINADYEQTSEELCIFGGTQGSEALRVDVWSGSWVNVITDLAAGWNNVSISSYLTSSAFEIRFTDTSDDSVEADTWQVEAVLLHTWTEEEGESITIYELIELSDSTTTQIALVQLVSELIELSDSAGVVMSAVITIMELIGLAGVVSTEQTTTLLIMESIGIGAVVSTVGNYGYTSNELIDLASATQTSIFQSVTIYELIDLFETVSTQVFEGGQYYVTIYELIELSDSASTVLNGVVVVYELVPIFDSSTTAMSVVVTIHELIELFDSTTAGYPVYIIVIYEIIPIGDTFSFVGGELVTSGLLYQLFLSPEMWGYFGPALVVVGGYFVASKEKTLGVLWFVMECLIIGYYLSLVEATPSYWWHIVLLLIGGVPTCIYSFSRK